ncbi:putative Flagellin domain protein [uncultured delta proteobacterium]|uniref:Putative Flagellin domain protein n=1 Tax=uncultured delta proteobacterium TaxID=34034 RepID=A0A212K0D7_9DELT|nr:putative Flagellin domain protein [uncultured delta proteobacterium]
MSDYLRHQTLALLGQEFLTQALLSGDSLNSVVANALLQPKAATTGKEKAAAALTGRIRSDSAVLRQGAKNAGEAASMAEMIKNATMSVAETLSGMQTIVQAVRNGQMTAEAATPEYQSLVSKLTATIEGAQYNGISLLDKSAWGADERLTVTSDKTATVSIQVGDTASTFTLRDISNMKNFKTANLAADNATLDRYLSNIALNLDTANTMASGYESLAGSYTAEAKYLERQADTLSLAAQKTMAGASPEAGTTEQSLKSLLIDLLLRDQGRVVDTAS